MSAETSKMGEKSIFFSQFSYTTAEERTMRMCRLPRLTIISFYVGCGCVSRIVSHNIFIFVLIITVKLLWLTSIRARFCATTQNFLLLLLLLIHTRASNPIVSCIICDVRIFFSRVVINLQFD